MVPHTGTASNRSDAVITSDLPKSNLDHSVETQFLSGDYDALFNTLAQWTDYLEDHVPYFSQAPQEEEPQP